MGDLATTLEELYKVIFYGLGIAKLGVTGIILLVGVITFLVSTVISLLVSLVVFLLQAIPLYRISKKMGRPLAWLVWLSWIPVIGPMLSVFVLSDIPGNKPVRLIKNVKIEKRLTSFWIYIIITFFGKTIITALTVVANAIPGVGQVLSAFSALLAIVPNIAIAWMEYAYLRDILDIYKPDSKKNNITAIVIAVLDSVATFGFARAIYLYTVMNKEPLSRQVVEEV